MTKQEAIRKHRKMWEWIAVETLKRERKAQKREYFIAMGVSACDRPVSRCFCCEYDKQKQEKFHRCEVCPIEWPSDREYAPCCDSHSLYLLWAKEQDYKKAALLAYKISKLPKKIGGKSPLKIIHIRSGGSVYVPGSPYRHTAGSCF